MAHPSERLFFRMTATIDKFQRELILKDAWANPAAAEKQSGRQRAMDSGKFRLVESLLRDEENQNSVGNAIDHLRAGRMAFYRYFQPNRIWQIRNGHVHGRNGRSPPWR